MDTARTKALIVGTGPAGYTAAIYAARANLAPMIVAGNQPGGQLTITTDVENYPGFADAIQGPWLMEQMREQALKVGAQVFDDEIVRVDLSSRPFRADGASGKSYFGDALIVATGAQARWLGIPSEREFRGYGVSACATCDGFFFKGKRVAVIGGGNSAVEEALYLTHHAESVVLVHRRAELKAEQILQERLFKNPKISVVWNHRVEEIIGIDDPVKAVQALRLRHVQSGQLQEVEIDGVFVAVGHDPASALFKGQLDTDSSGYIKIGNWSTSTSVNGVFAAGDISDPRYRQAVTAAGMGCMAALEAEKFLSENQDNSSRNLTLELVSASATAQEVQSYASQ